MQKVTVESIEENEAPVLKFPCVMIRVQDNLIVRFRADGEGVVLDPGMTQHEICDYTCGWEMSYFEPWEGTITITVE